MLSAAASAWWLSSISLFILVVVYGTENEKFLLSIENTDILRRIR
jgi:hypothetical protein